MTTTNTTNQKTIKVTRQQYQAFMKKQKRNKIGKTFTSLTLAAIIAGSAFTGNASAADNTHKFVSDTKVTITATKKVAQPTVEETKTGNTYTVIKGDCLSIIAIVFDTTVNELKAVNNLKTDALKVGQELIIPTLKSVSTAQKTEVAKVETATAKVETKKVKEVVSTNTYLVTSGDSLWRVSKKFGTTVDALVEANDLNSIDLKVGQKLIIPTSKSVSTAEKATVKKTEVKKAEKTQAEVSGVSVFKYTVIAGDTIWSLAKKYGVSVEEIKELNALKHDAIIIGQELIIPSKQASVTKHGYVTGVVDNNSIEISSEGVIEVLRLENAMNYQKFEGKFVDFTYTVNEIGQFIISSIK